MQASKTAYKDLLDFAEEYFASESGSDTVDSGSKIHQTSLPPIYLQRPRHSLTIVGFESRLDGSRLLLVFDPGYDPPKGLKESLLNNTAIKHPKAVLRTYRKKERYLKRYRGFETLQLSHLDI